MAKFKKLALLCTALCVTLGLTAGCGLIGGNTSSSENESSAESSSTLPEASSEEISSDTTIESSSEESSSEESSDSTTATTYTVTVNNGTGSGTYNAETEVEISCEIPKWKQFDGWYNENNELVNRKETFTLTVAENVTLTPSFIDVNYIFVSEGTLTLVDGWDTTNIQEFTVSVPEAGTYALSSNSSAKFGENTEGLNVASYTFTATEAGDITLYAHHDDWEVSDGTEIEVSYCIYEIKGYDLTETGEYTYNMLANADIPFSFTAPEAGTYRISTSLNPFSFGYTETVEIYDYATWEVIGTFNRINYTIDSSVLVTLEKGQSTAELPFDTYSAWAWIKAESAYESIELDIKVETVETITLKEGDTTATIYEGENTKMVFTSAVDAAYTFTATNGNCQFGIWVDDYGGYLDCSVSNNSNTYSTFVTANEEFVLYLQYNNYTNPTPIEETINVAPFVGDDPANMTEVGSYSFAITETSVLATFTAPIAGTYSIDDGNKYTMYEEGATEGASVLEVTLAANESVTFTVKYYGIITLNIEKLPDVVALNLGETTVNVPAGENTLQLNVNNGEYLLTWNNENVIVNENGVPYTAGAMLSYSSYWSSLTITTTDGSALENVTFTLVAYEYPSVKLGDNSVSASTAGTTYKFTAAEIGCYTFTVVGEAVTDVRLNSDNAFDYPDALSSAGVISINVKADAVIDLFVQTSEDCNISVNVALTSTVNNLEASVTMNEDGTQPESLTIASLPNGACAYYVAMRMVGDYVISWSSDYNIVVYAGDNVGTSYDPQVRLTRTMEDAGVYLLIRNSDYEGANYENIVLNFAVYEEPAAEPQGQLVGLNEETTIEIAEWESVVISFVAPEAGTYTLTTTSSVLVDLWVNGNWGYDRAWVNVIDSTEGGSYTFELEEGQIIDFFAMEYDMGAVSFIFTITKA